MRRLVKGLLLLGAVVGLGIATAAPKQQTPSHHDAACGGCPSESNASSPLSLTGRKVSNHAFVVLANGNGIKEGTLVTIANLLKRDGVRGLVLDFVGTQCPYSRQQLQGVTKAIALQDGKAKGALVATVFVDADAQAVRRALKQRPVNTLVLWDKGGKVARQWQIKATPTVVVVRKDGQVIATYTGMAPPHPDMYQHFFASVLTAVANGSPPPPHPMMGVGGG
ncbi:Thiol-disulfide oxidoreductase ResA [bacterium HR17]|uniref:Thiol-disulfide oxidoreductase ResA n=1 Tax=Candidatus Fervidibacter japonicus TaxID=2035412 RepID=A0A2H5X8U3_9BACT|nr:Thiol-disulfide oxidoreductase ResA [bacterium HR17]